MGGTEDPEDATVASERPRNVRRRGEDADAGTCNRPPGKKVIPLPITDRRDDDNNKGVQENSVSNPRATREFDAALAERAPSDVSTDQSTRRRHPVCFAYLSSFSKYRASKAASRDSSKYEPRVSLSSLITECHPLSLGDDFFSGSESEDEIDDGINPKQ
jgi:hypothetical protein